MAFFFTAWGKSAPFGVGIEKPDQLERATPVFFFRIRDRPPPGREKVERPKTLFFSSRAVLISFLSAARLLPISTQTALDLSRYKVALFSDYNDLFLIFALGLTHDLSQELRRVSPFGTRRSTITLGDNAQPSLKHILGIKFMNGLYLYHSV